MFSLWNHNKYHDWSENPVELAYPLNKHHNALSVLIGPKATIFDGTKYLQANICSS